MLDIPRMIVSFDDNVFCISPLPTPLEIREEYHSEETLAHITHKIIDEEGDVCYMLCAEKDEDGETPFMFGYFPVEGQHLFMPIEDEETNELLESVIYYAVGIDAFLEEF